MRKISIIQNTMAAVVAFFLLNSCSDHVPDIEELPNPLVDFNYSIKDDTYKIDYYIGATVEFTSISKATGECIWDFGDGTTATGSTVIHKYAKVGTFQVKLTVGNEGYNNKPIYISDIKPILKLNPIPGGLCEVLTAPVSFNVTLPNPEELSEEYTWYFPEGSLDKTGNTVTTFSGKDPGEIRFSNVGSQTIVLEVKLGGRLLEEGIIKVPVAYNKPVPTLYYAVSKGNIMAVKLANDAPAGMKIMPFDMGVKSGQHPLNILFNDTSLYVVDCGKQFTYVNDVDANQGDGRIFVMSKSGSKVETMLTNSGAAFSDPFYGYIDGNKLYFADRNTGITAIGINERNRTLSATDFPYYVQNNTLGYYSKGLSYGAINASFGKVENAWYWCKTFNGNGIFRFKDSDILKTTATENDPAPTLGVAIAGMSPKSYVWDNTRKLIYFTIWDTGYAGLYKCTLNQLNAISTRTDLIPYQMKLANGKTVTPVTEPGKGEGATGEFIGICQLALDESDGSVYFGLRSGDASVKSGLMRYNPATNHIEYVIEGINAYGVSVNKSLSKLF